MEFVKQDNGKSYVKMKPQILLDEKINMLAVYDVFNKYPQVFEEIKSLYLDQIDDLIERRLANV